MKDLTALSDMALVSETRRGHTNSYAVLWQRHVGAAMNMARSFTSIDADDVVAEAFTLIYTAIRKGEGPTSAFRPYLFTTLRNVAAGWGRAHRAISMDNLDQFADWESQKDTFDGLLDKSLTATAFNSLPRRWQEVLWYCDVESMPPREVGSLLGMRPNAVSALAIRAREGLRVAWIRAHLSSTDTEPECSRTIERLPGWARGTLTVAMGERVNMHLERCRRCRDIADEASTVNTRLALVLLPLTVGAAGASAYLATDSGSSAAAVSLAYAQPEFSLPSIPHGEGTRTGIVASLTAAGASVLVAGGLSIALSLGPAPAGSESESRSQAPANPSLETTQEPAPVTQLSIDQPPAPSPSQAPDVINSDEPHATTADPDPEPEPKSSPASADSAPLDPGPGPTPDDPPVAFDSEPPAADPPAEHPVTMAPADPAITTAPQVPIDAVPDGENAETMPAEPEAALISTVDIVDSWARGLY
ncbi:sigma-70 family RNA polymerase sigma factor [Agreia bicolorata]|uniref:sigma-70 family RNA polymerase sigma factor n=1 Tax=Agreia bicolorata TaxID=110935 RepID=UPI000698526E|nr:sigma-70 family RNA polymerase sigma factor [Agreia bicolorata]